MMTARPDMQRYLKLLPIQEAQKRIDSKFKAIGTEQVSVDDSIWRVCAEEVRSRRDVPKWSISAMDGYAIRSTDTKKASPAEPLRLKTRVAVDRRIGQGEAMQVSTGDQLPAGSDSVIRVEETRIEDDGVMITGSVQKWKNVSIVAADLHAREVILRNGEFINPAIVALLISAGITKVKTFAMPRVGVVSVGTELKRFGDDTPGKTANNYANLILGYLAEYGTKATMVGVVRDDLIELRDLLVRVIDDFDMIVTIGGASVGPGDLTPDAVLLDDDSAMVFHGLRAVPIRPVGLAKVRGKPIAILPGHAVSVALSFFMVALPVLNVISGLTIDSRMCVLRAIAVKSFSNERPIDALWLVTVKRRRNGYYAEPLGWGSNLVSNLSRANGFVRLRARETIHQEQIIDVQLLGSAELSRVAG